LSLSIVLMPIIGGVGTLVGPVLGALIVSTLQIKLLSMPALRDSFLFIYGGLLILLMLFEPHGFVGIGKRVWAVLTRTARSGTRLADAG
jgi:branched-chain amino acid transport system permease protein